MADKKQTNPTGLKRYRVTEARFILGQWRKPDEILNLMPQQAKYYLPPMGSGLVVEKPQAAPEPKLDKKTA